MRDEWYVARRGQGGNTRYGPVRLQELRALLDQGKVMGEDLVWCEGMPNWQRADQCDALFSSRSPRPGPWRDRRGYGPEEDDDRPYRRPYPPPRQSSGALTVLLVVGGVIGVCVLGCAGLGFIGYMNARSSAISFAPPAPPPVAVNPMPLPALPPNDGVIFDPGVPQNGLGQAIPFGTSDLYYTNNILPADAQALGDYLDRQGVFPNDHGVTVQLDKNAFGTYLVRFCVKDGVAFDPDVYNYYRDLRGDIADNVFPLGVVEVDLCDANMNNVRTIQAGD